MEIVGVVDIDPWLILDSRSPFIKDLLYFDKICYSLHGVETLEMLGTTLSINGENRFNQRIQEIQKLEETGLLYRLDVETLKVNKTPSEIEQFIKLTEEALELIENWNKSWKEDGGRDFKGFFTGFLETFRETSQLRSRKNAILLNKSDDGRFFVPIIKNRFPFSKSIETSSTSVLNILINKFPIVSDDIELNQLVEFKSDTEAKQKLLHLKDWIFEISKKTYNEKEIQQKIEFLLNEYTQQLKLHKLKFKAGRIETILTTTAEVLENTLKLNFSKATKAFFDLGKQDIQLLEAETKIPGREIAYLYKAKRAFDK